MSGTTPNRALPYPTSSDLVADGAQAIQDLATAIDTDLDTLFGMQRGTLTIPASNGAATLSGSVTLDPAIFTAAPSTIIVTPRDSYSDVGHVYIGSRSAGGFTVGAKRIDGAVWGASPLVVDWVAWV